MHPSGLADPGAEGKLLEQDYRLSLKQKTNTFKAKEESAFKVFSTSSPVRLFQRENELWQFSRAGKVGELPKNCSDCSQFSVAERQLKQERGHTNPSAVYWEHQQTWTLPDLPARGVFPHFCTCLFYTQLQLCCLVWMLWINTLGFYLSLVWHFRRTKDQVHSEFSQWSTYPTAQVSWCFLGHFHEKSLCSCDYFN